METIKELVAAGRDRDGAAIDALDRSAPYSYRDFCTNAWKAGNLLSHYGIRPGATLAVLAGPKEATAESEFGDIDSPDPLLAVLGAATVGAAADLTPAEPVDERAAVLPTGWLDQFEFAPGCSLVAYGGPPEDPSVTHFEGQSWSENPIEPPDPVSQGDDLLVSGDDRFTHGQTVAATGALVERHDLDENSRIALDAPVTVPGALVAGLFAPLSVGATIVLGGANVGDVLSEEAEYVVTPDESSTTSEATHISAAEVTRLVRKQH